MGKIFLCYRREDSGAHAGRVKDWLEGEFGTDMLFMDVDNIPMGRNFVKALNEEVAQCEVLLAFIGKNWLDARDEDGRRRLDDPKDFVRIEIEAALQRDIAVVPILLDGARIPKPKQLPTELEELSYRNGIDLRQSSFRDDVARLIQGLKKELGAIEAATEVAVDYRARGGYDPAFLGPRTVVDLPTVDRNANDILYFEVDGTTETELRYEHFSVLMSCSRRMCFLSACNIDGNQLRKSARAAWKWDPRIF